MREELQDIVESLRVAKYPELDADLVAEILSIERQHLDRRSGVLIQIEQAIDAFLYKAEAQ